MGFEPVTPWTKSIYAAVLRVREHDCWLRARGAARIGAVGVERAWLSLVDLRLPALIGS